MIVQTYVHHILQQRSAVQLTAEAVNWFLLLLLDCTTISPLRWRSSRLSTGADVGGASAQLDSDTETDHSSTAGQHRSAAGFSQKDDQAQTALQNDSDQSGSPETEAPTLQADPDHAAARHNVASEQSSDCDAAAQPSTSQPTSPSVPDNAYAQPSPLHSSSEDSQSSKSGSPDQEACHSSRAKLSSPVPDASQSGSQGLPDTASDQEVSHQSNSATVSEQVLTKVSGTQSPAQSKSSLGNEHQHPFGAVVHDAAATSPEGGLDSQPASQQPAGQLADKGGKHPSTLSTGSTRSLVDTSTSNTSRPVHSMQAMPAQGKSTPIPRKPWQREDVNQQSAFSSQSDLQSASVPFWQRGDSGAASSDAAVAPFWLRKDASSADAGPSDDTASVKSEPVRSTFRPQSNAGTRDASDAASDIAGDLFQPYNFKYHNIGAPDLTSMKSHVSPTQAGCTQNHAPVTVASDAVPVWQRPGDGKSSIASNTAAASSGSAHVPFWQLQDRGADTTAPELAVPGQSRNSSAASANVPVPFWQNRPTSTAASQLVSQASASSIASSSRGAASDFGARASTAQRALFEGQGNSHSSSAPQQPYLGNSQHIAAICRTSSNTQASEIAKLQAQAMRRSGVMRRHAGGSRAGSSLGSPSGSVASVATSAWPDTPRSRR